MQRIYGLDFNKNEDIKNVLDDLLKITSKTDDFIQFFKNDPEDDHTYSYWLRWAFGHGQGGKVVTQEDVFVFENETDHAQAKLGCWMYDGVFHFISQVIKLGMEEKLVQLVLQIGALQKNSPLAIWCNDETLLGSEPAFILAMHEKKYINLYTRFISQVELDALDHESQQVSSIKPLLNRYGYCQEYIHYLVSVGVRTQGGSDYLSSACRSKEFAQYITKTDGFKDFVSLVKDRYREVLPENDHESIDDYTRSYFENLEKTMAPDEYLQVEVKGKKIALTGKAPLDRDIMSKILEFHGSLVDSAIKKDTQILVCPAKSKETAKVVKAKEQGVQIYAYEDFFSLPAWKNELDRRMKALRAAVNARDIEKVSELLHTVSFAVESRDLDFVLKGAIDEGGCDDFFIFFVEKHYPADKNQIYARLACDYGKNTTEKLKFLLEKYGFDKEAAQSTFHSIIKNKYYQSDPKIMKEHFRLFIQLGASVDFVFSRNLTLLHVACDEFDYDIELIKLLLDNGADPNVLDDRGRSAFAIAANSTDFEFYRPDQGDHVQDFSRDYTNSDLSLYLFDHKKNNQDQPYQKGFDLVKLMVDSGKVELDFEKVETAGVESALMSAARRGNWQIVDFLMDVGTVNTQPGWSTGKNNPFINLLVMCEPEDFNFEVFKKAYEKGTHPNQCCDYHRNTLFHLTWNGRMTSLEAIACLIDLGGDPFFQDKNGESCADKLKVIDGKSQEQLYSYIKTKQGKAVLDKVFL